MLADVVCGNCDTLRQEVSVYAAWRPAEFLGGFLTACVLSIYSWLIAPIARPFALVAGLNR